MPRKKPNSLTNAEHRIMEVIWAKGSATVAEVVEALRGKDAYTTILTLMRILKDKGYLSTRKEGRAFVFVPRVNRETVARNAVHLLLSKFFAGSASELVLAFLREEEITPDELDEIKLKIMESGMIAMKNEILTISDHLVTAALNSVYQGIFIVLIIALALRFLCRTNAATRHAVWFVTLLLLVSLIPAHYWLDMVEKPSDSLPLGNQAQLSALPSSKSPLSLVAEESADPVEDRFIPLPASEADIQDPPMLVRSVLEVPSDTGLKLERLLNPLSWNLASFPALPKAAGLVLVVFWIIFASLRLGILFWRLWEIRKLKFDSLPPATALLELFRNLCRDLRITRNIRLRVSFRRHSPVVLGFVHPVILLPADESNPLDLDQTRHVLDHELAHVRRWDDWANLIQHSIRATLFFHPAIWWVCRQLSLEREIACDDFVLHQGGRPRSYALLLANFAGHADPRHSAFAPGVSNHKSQLQQRINMILNTRRNISPGLAKARMGILTLAAVAVSLLAIYAAPRLVLAQTPVTPAPALQPIQPVDVIPPSDLTPIATVQVSQTDTEPPETEPSATPAPSDVEPGAKFKPGDSSPEDAPQPTMPPAIPKAPKHPKHAKLATPAPMPSPAELPEPALTPRPPRARHGDREESGIEARLDRLEEMVHSLMGQPKVRSRLAPLEADGRHVMIDPMDMQHFQEMAKHAEMATEQAKRAVEQAKRDAELAAQQAKRAVTQAQREAERAAAQTKRAAEQRARTMEQDKHMADQSEDEEKADAMEREPNREARQEQIQSLQKQREDLEKEMQKLQRKIDRLQRDKDKKEHGQQHRSENRNETTAPEEASSQASVNF